jgi:plasmid stabilization system protein ParE
VKFRLAPQARADLDTIWIHIARDAASESIATHVVESIVAKFKLFARFPFLGRTLASERHSDVRSFAVHPYVIFYRPLPDEIRILRVIHASRDAFALFNQNQG